MESSPFFSRSSSSASPNINLDRQPRLTVTQLQQFEVEEKVAEIYRVLKGVFPHAQLLMLELWRDKHVEFLTRGLEQLGPSYHVLDANRPWLCYWILHSIALLGKPLDPELENNVVDFLSRCEDKYGGYGGGPGQLPHLATTYAAVNTLVTLGSENALSSKNRDNLYKFLLRMKDSSGAFRMHDAGEIDVSASYTAISVASILNILDYELVKDVGNYILRCQTYEGDITGEPGSEAHGGYTFCGLATMILIDEADRLDLSSLLENFQTLVSISSKDMLNLSLYSTALPCKNIYSFVHRYWKEGSRTSLGNTETSTTRVTVSVGSLLANIAG